jgi:hypothetical protein
MLQTDSNHRSTPHHPSGQNSPNRVPHSTTSLDHPRNILHHQHRENPCLLLIIAFTLAFPEVFADPMQLYFCVAAKQSPVLPCITTRHTPDPIVI